MPLISVIIPVYKVENVLYHCIDSILKQTFKDFELILVDDGSPDGCGAICDSYAEKDCRIRVFHNINRGVSFARNFGINVALGEYVCFVDSDDFVQPNYLLRLWETAKSNPGCLNIWCGINMVDDYRKHNLKLCVYDQYETISRSSFKEIMTLTEKMLEASPCNKLYKKQIIIDNNLSMDESISLGEDAIFNLQYLDCTNGDIIVINEGLYNYVVSHQDSLVKKYYKDELSLHRNIYYMFCSYMSKWCVDDSECVKNVNAMIYRYCFVLENTFNKQNKDGFLQKLNYIRDVIKSPEFKDVLNKCTVRLSSFFVFSCTHNCTFLLYVYFLFEKFKRKIYKAVKK